MVSTFVGIAMLPRKAFAEAVEGAQNPQVDT
jgi:hypothetical protein